MRWLCAVALLLISIGLVNARDGMNYDLALVSFFLGGEALILASRIVVRRRRTAGRR